MAVTVGHSNFQKVFSVTVDFSSVPAGATVSETVTVAGLNTTHFPLVKMSALEMGLRVLGADCVTNGTLRVWIENLTAGDINPASQTLDCVVL